MLSNSKSCGVRSRVDADQAYLFTPALCTNSCREADSVPADSPVCKERYGDTGVCCSADKIPFYSTNFPDVRLEQRELSYKFYGSQPSVDWSKVSVVELGHPTGPEENHELKSHLMTDLQNEKVCGIRSNEKDYVLFFCIQAERCSAPPDGSQTGPYIAEPSWNEFCNNEVDYAIDYTRDEYRCCHTNYFPQDHFNRTYTNLQFQKIPTFLKFAVGLRSNFMCEAYSRFVCGDSADECTPTGYPSERPPDMLDAIRAGDAPYIARLGVVAPHVLIFHCLGAIVSHRYIISVWDCRQKHGIDTNIVVTGEDDTDDLYLEDNTIYEQVYVISKIIRFDYQNYEPTLYRTAKDMQFSPRARPACLYYRPMERPTEADLPFFGKLRNDNWSGRFLRRQKVKLHPKRDHQEYVEFCQDPALYQQDNLNVKYRISGPDWKWEFCGGEGLGSGFKNGPCKYDRGSPLVVKMAQPYCSWLILGLLTTERWNCEQDTPMVFSNTTKWLSLIEDVLWPQPFLDFHIPPRSCGLPVNEPASSYWKYTG